MVNFNMWLCGYVLITIATSLSRAAEYKAKCGTNQYRCGNGVCISINKICDGIPDCSDGSDETLPICTRIPASNSSVCEFPPYPEHGTYKVHNNPDARPGQSRDFFELTVTCRRGYGLDPYIGSDTQQVYCIKGKWRQKMPRCVRFCRLDPNPSVRYMCFIPGIGFGVCKNYVPPGTTVDAICNTPIYHSTEVLPNMKCRSGFWNYVAVCKAECGRITPGAKQLVAGGRQVKRGELPWCVAIYQKTSESYSQICSGSLVTNNVVISAAHCFWTNLRKLIPASEFKVAAGKLYRAWDSENDTDVQKSDFLVVVEEARHDDMLQSDSILYYTDDSTGDALYIGCVNIAQGNVIENRNKLVKEIRIPSLFAGESANYQEDIAAMILSNPFTYTTYIRPVCLDFSTFFDALQLQDNNYGKVAGWGLTSANGNASDILMVINIPFINDVTCTATVPASFREYITGDKFCAGYTNGTALCQGDSGGGLAFPTNEKGIDRYYLRGVVSTAPNEDNKSCNVNTYTAFTKVTKHQVLIKGALEASDKKVCSSSSFQCADGSCADLGSDCNGRRDCADGSDESEEFCLAGITNKESFPNPQIGIQVFTEEFNNNCGVFTEINDKILANEYQYMKGNMPWLAAIYSKVGNDISFICGGTLISERHVITVAHLMPDTRTIVVKLGADNVNNWTKVTAVRAVTSATVVKTFNAKTYLDDLSILTLDKNVNFNQFIKPACLWNGNTELNAIVGASGVFSGWGESVPHLFQMPIVSLDVCRSSNRPYEYLSLEKILCAGDNKNLQTNVTISQPGGGLYLLIKSKWVLRGILMVPVKYKIPNTDRPLTHVDYGVFVDTVQYLPWIRKTLELD